MQLPGKPRSWQKGVRTGFLLAVAVLVYVLLGKISYEFSQINDEVSENIFLPQGFSLALGLLAGLRSWPVVVIGQLYLGHEQGLPWLLNLLTTLANTAVMVTGVTCLRLAGFRISIERSIDYLLLILVEAIILQPVSRILGSYILWLVSNNLLPSWHDFLDPGNFWMLEQATCQVSITSVLLAYNDRWRHGLRPQYVLELAALSAMAGWSGLFLLQAEGHWLSLLHIISTAYLGTLLMASRLGLAGAMTGNIILLIFTQYAMHNGHSPFVQLGDARAQLEFINLLVVGVMLSSGFFSTLLRERDDQTRMLKILAHQDVLTGLYNRRHFYQYGEQLLARLRRHAHGEASLIAIDLDFFKRADHALYEAKRTGRNRVISAEPPPILEFHL
ncbi:MAG: diguanylate cyclase [Pseudomonadales bacterium]|nr:diguanylate cyclase [Pseudomonadales bacterium]